MQTDPTLNGKYDKREYQLGLSKTTNEQGQVQHRRHLTDCAVFENHLTDSFCDNLINTYKQDIIKKEPPVIGSNTGTIDKSIRDTERVLTPTEYRHRSNTYFSRIKC
jgi:hypothetical protein